MAKEYNIDLMQTTMAENKSALSTIIIVGKYQYLAKTMQTEKTDGFYQTVRLAAIEADRAASIREQEATSPNKLLEEIEADGYKTLEIAHVNFLSSLDLSELEKKIHWD